MLEEKSMTLINKLGLHARAAAKLVALAKDYTAEITITNDAKVANAKSMISVMQLAAAKGTTLLVTADGTDAKQAINALEQLIKDRFGEDE